VLDEYNADAFTPGNLAQQPNQSITLARSQPAENLVKQEQFRPGSQSTRELEQLAIGQSEHGGSKTAFRTKTHTIENGIGAFTRFFDPGATTERADNDVVEYRQTGKRFHDLKRPREAAPTNLIRPQPIDATAVENNRAGIRRLGTGDDVEERRFTGAVWADQSSNGVWPDFKGNIRERP
jgi:hypothetical protein